MSQPKIAKFSYLLRNSMCCVILIELHEENLATHRYVVGKGNNNLIDFSDTYSFIIQLGNC